MIPYILAAVGGYLIGDSLKGNQFADGGMMADKYSQVVKYWGELKSKMSPKQLKYFEKKYKERENYLIENFNDSEIADYINGEIIEQFGKDLKITKYNISGKNWFKLGFKFIVYRECLEEPEFQELLEYAEGGITDIKIKLYNIDYDTEDEDVRTIKSLKKNNLLPQVIETTAEKMGWGRLRWDGDNLEEFVEYRGADFISDETGFLVNSFNFEISK